MGASIRIAILADAAKARAEIASTSTAASKLGSGFSKLGALAKAGAVAGIIAVAAAAKVGVSDALAYEAAQNKATAALKVNGGASQQTIGSLKTRAASIETLTGATQDENDILDAQTRLLRTGITSNKQFGDATLAAANLAAAGNQNISAASKGLAKALQDPTKAAGALRKANVTLSASQQENIKKLVAQGDTAKAQGIVIDAVNTQLSGSAAAAGKGTAASFAIIKDTLQDTARDLAVRLLPAFAAVASFLRDKLPPAVDFVNKAFDKISGAVSGILPSFDTLKTAFGVLVTVLQNPVFQAFAAAIGAIAIAMQVYATYQAIVTAATAAWAAVQAALNVVLAANPIGLIVLAIIGLVAAFVVAYHQSEAFRDIVNGAFGAVKDFVVGVWQAISGTAKAAFSIVSSIVSGTVSVISGLISGFRNVAVAVWDAISSAASSIWNAIKLVISLVIQGITVYIQTYKAVVLAIWEAISSAASAAWNLVKSVISSAIDSVKDKIDDVKSKASEVWSSVRTTAQAAFDAVKQKVSSVIDSAKDKFDEIKSKITGIDLFSAGQELIARLARGVEAGAQAVIDKVQNMLSKVKGLLPGSPIKDGPLKGWNNTGAGGPGGRLMGLLASGISSGAPMVQAAVSSVAAGIAAVPVSFDVNGSGGSSSSSNSGSVTTIRIEGTANASPDARSIIKTLNDYSRLNGPIRIEVA